MNGNVNQRFVLTCEIVFTTQQDMDEFDAQHFFEQEISEWEGMRSDLNFESVKTREVVELPADPNEYNEHRMRSAVVGLAKAADGLKSIGG